MTRRPIDEQLMTDFLLGNLPDEEIQRLDEMSLTDDDFVNRLQAVENDLVDTYVRGELSGNSLNQFRSNYLQSPNRREKVAFAETLQRLTNKSSIASLQQTNYKSRSLAVAAAIVLITAGYLIFENFRLQNRVRQMQVEKESFRNREQELQKQITELKHRPGTPKQDDVKLMAFVLLPQTRGINKIPLITIPAGTDYLALTLKLETDDFEMYQASLKDPTTLKVLWQSENLKAENNISVQVKIPASLLKTQIYFMELSGISASGAAEVVSSYPFRIAAQ
jgi:hypothetical protein